MQRQLQFGYLDLLLCEGIRVYLEGVEEELTVHAQLPAQTSKSVRHANEHNVVHPEHQHQHQRGLRQFPARTDREIQFNIDSMN